MSADTTAMHSPLHDPERDAHNWVPSVDIALDCARQELAEHANANIHDAGAMLAAAVTFEIRLRQLVAALDKEAGR